ncbi:unnamed protein product [Paramecium sonneborni]|uniref:Uncharacterized protein n=1 Tax=Paramecium sonneborni TaxID=65129 RepID=A0A8S1KGX1_9CILI|nr:unnamed protein product [Paramecium sonneborni]
MIKTRKSMRAIEQQTNKFYEFLIEMQPKNYSTQPYNRKSQKKFQNLHFPKVDNSNSKDPFLNNLKVTTLDLVKNFDYMDPNDVTFQLNQMVKQQSFISSTKPFSRIHQRSQPKHRNPNKSLFEISKTIKII